MNGSNKNSSIFDYMSDGDKAKLIIYIPILIACIYFIFRDNVVAPPIVGEWKGFGQITLERATPQIYSFGKTKGKSKYINGTNPVRYGRESQNHTYEIHPMTSNSKRFILNSNKYYSFNDNMIYFFEETGESKYQQCSFYAKLKSGRIEIYSGESGFNSISISEEVLNKF